MARPAWQEAGQTRAGRICNQARPGLPGLDWAGDPLPFSPEGLGRPEDGQDEVDLRWVAAHGESTFDGMIAHFEEYTDVVGDHPSNMVATTLGLNAYALTAEPQYRDWVL